MKSKNNCPEGYETPYDILRDGCVDCKDRVCLLPDTTNEYGEWYAYFIDSLVTTTGAYRERAQIMTMEYYYDIGKEIIETVLDNKERAKYGDKIFHSVEKDLKNQGVKICKTDLYASVAMVRKYPRLEDCPARNWTSCKKLIGAGGDVKVLGEPKKSWICKVENCPKRKQK